MTDTCIDLSKMEVYEEVRHIPRSLLVCLIGENDVSELNMSDYLVYGKEFGFGIVDKQTMEKHLQNLNNKKTMTDGSE